MIQDAIHAFNQMFAKPFRGVLLKTIALTLLLFIAVAAGGFELLKYAAEDFATWMITAAGIVAALIYLVASAFLFPPVTALVASLFLDDVAEIVEKEDYPADPPGKPMPTMEAIAQGLKFMGVVIGVNILVLLLIWLPGINAVLFFAANGYLLGREYFELAAHRFRSREDVRDMRKANAGTLFIAGMIIALFVAIPILNLMTPLFATIFMVHTHKRLSGSKFVSEV
ncbi:sulfate transporter family protein [Tepidamorphus sp. 3E244]|uniref:sulfate transporter family protein n=1 Tax=Tepidamorphus sp. 3E244 TaxID=3385498 RepID=UPI0038FBEBB1